MKTKTILFGANLAHLALVGLFAGVLAWNVFRGNVLWIAFDAIGVAVNIAFIIQNIRRARKEQAEMPIVHLSGISLFPGLGSQSILNTAGLYNLAAPQSHSNALQQQMTNAQMTQQLLLMQAGGAFDTAFRAPVYDSIALAFINIATALPMFPDPDVSNTMGFRSWLFDFESGLLRSPHTGTPWEEAELHCETWAEGDVIRGVAGIHAHLAPYDWKRAPKETSAYAEIHTINGVSHIAVPVVTGIVERFGRFVLGTEGWRAEWVMIRKLHAPSRAVAAALTLTYENVEITHEDR